MKLVAGGWLLVVGCWFLVAGEASAQDSTKTDSAKVEKRAYPDTAYFQGWSFSSQGPSYPVAENGFIYYIGPTQSPLWRAEFFPQDIEKEIAGFMILTSRFDKASKHKYDLTIFAIADTTRNVNTSFQQRSYFDTTKSFLGTVSFSTGNKPPQEVGKKLDKQKIDTTIVMLKSSLDPFGTVVLTNGKRENLKGVLGFMLRRPPAQALDDSKTVSSFYALGLIMRERGKREVETVDLSGVKARFLKEDNEMFWVVGFLGVIFVGAVVLMFKKRKGKKA